MENTIKIIAEYKRLKEDALLASIANFYNRNDENEREFNEACDRLYEYKIFHGISEIETENGTRIEIEGLESFLFPRRSRGK